MADDVQGGYHKVENEDGEALYRVPDLLNEADFIAYMADVYGVTVTIT